MWPEIASHLARYPSAVVTGLDAGGYPYSLRCVPEPLPAQQALRLPADGDVPWQPGPAGLLCHWHNDQLWNQTSFVLRGRLEPASGGEWLFYPTQLIEGAGGGGGMSVVRQLRAARRAAQNYLSKRGLSRPRIPWAALKEIYDRAQKH